MVNDLWKLKPNDVNKLGESDLVKLTKYKIEIGNLKKLIKSIKHNKKIENREARILDKSNLQKGYQKKPQSVLWKTKVKRLIEIKKIETRIANVKEIGQMATARCKREGYLITYADQPLRKKNYGMSRSQFNDFRQKALNESRKVNKPHLKNTKQFKRFLKENNLTMPFQKYEKIRSIKIWLQFHVRRLIKLASFVVDLFRLFHLKAFLVAIELIKINDLYFEQSINKLDYRIKVNKIKAKYQFKYELKWRKLDLEKAVLTRMHSKTNADLKILLSKAKDKHSLYSLFYNFLPKMMTKSERQQKRQKIKDLQKEHHHKNISQKAYRQALRIISKKTRANTNLLRFENKKYRLHSEYVQNKKVAFKNIFKEVKMLSNEKNELYKTIPSEVKKWEKFVLAPLSIVIPGLPYFARGQFKSGMVLMLFVPLIAIFSIYAFGIYNVNGNGVLGLYDAGLTKGLVDLTVDSRFWVIEGIIGMVLLIVVLIYGASMFLTTWKTYRALEIGINPRTWIDVKRGLVSNGFPYIISIPALSLILLIVIVPILATFYFSLTNYGPGALPPGQLIEYIGFKNYELFFAKSSMLLSLERVLVWTIIFTVGSSLTSIIAGISLGILTNNEHLKGRKLFRFIFLLPSAIPSFITIGMFSLLISPEGLISQWTGVTTWKTNLTNARIIILIIQTWIGYSASYLMTIGVINAVPNDQKEAAIIAGVSRVKRLRHLVLPIILFQLTPLIIGTFLSTFNNFAIIYIVTNGGPSYPVSSFGIPGATDTVVSWILKLTEGSNPFHGVSAAFLMLSTILILPISAFSMLRSKAVRKEQL